MVDEGVVVVVTVNDVVVDAVGAVVEVWSDPRMTSTHPVSTTNATKRPGSRFIGSQLWHGLAANRRNLGAVFGPLNGVRTALVIAAFLAALVSLIVGYPGAAAVLLVGVGIHGLGWLYLYATRDRARVD